MNLSGKHGDGFKPARLLASQCAFSRTDLLAVIFIVVILGIWIGAIRLGERGRIVRCADNLSRLGRAMQDYADDNDGALPAASIDLGKLHASWDIKLIPYLKPGMTKAGSEQFFERAHRFFTCPSDMRSDRANPRSFAMSDNSMQPKDWPPGPDSVTGVGLKWDKQAVLTLLNEDMLLKPDSLPAVKLANIAAPSDTLLLTELVNPTNRMSSVLQATVAGIYQQQQPFEDGGARFHNGRFNYLMVDGHVEWLSPLQTGSYGSAAGSTAGIWSLNKGD